MQRSREAEFIHSFFAPSPLPESHEVFWMSVSVSSICCGWKTVWHFSSVDFFCLPPPCSSLLNTHKTGHSYLEPLCFQVKAAKELEENSNKIDSLLNWVASLEQKGGLLEYRPHPIEQAPGVQVGTGTQDVPDGHVVRADSAAESLDEQYERLKVRTNTSSLSKLSLRHADPASGC